MTGHIAVIHYDEIALKGGNRGMFEGELKARLLEKLHPVSEDIAVDLLRGRILVRNVPGMQLDVVSNILARTPGIVYYGIGTGLPRVAYTDNEILERDAGNILLQLSVLHSAPWQSFRVSVKRSDKTYGKTSQDLERELGEVVYEHYHNNDDPRSVSLKNPDIELVCEILTDRVLLYIKQVGIGGLPVGSSGKAVVLLSGGFDSPVAAYMLAKRGVRPVAVHFHALPQTSEQSVDKVRDICKVLAQYTGTIDLHLVPVVPAMRTIALDAGQDKLRLILLRRLMNRVAERIAERVGAKALITGESVGQVASQTLENMRATAEPVSLPILRPLSGLNKQEIIALSRTIGTHDISALQYDDTCSHFMPKQPETRAKLAEIHDALKAYDEDALIEQALSEATTERHSA